MFFRLCVRDQIQQQGVAIQKCVLRKTSIATDRMFLCTWGRGEKLCILLHQVGQI